MPLRLTFGGALCPYEWGIISETICDLATAIIKNDVWDPDDLQAPNQENSPYPNSWQTMYHSAKKENK